MAIRSFIQQEVDYIVLVPGTEEGWDTVLGEAKDMGIPVIIADRMVNVKDDSLYAAWVGADFLLEGQKVCEYLEAYTEVLEIEEMLRICSRMAVLRDGKKVGELSGEELSQEGIMKAIAGGGEDE